MMPNEIRQVREENLSPRQHAFLIKLRQHDQKVVVLRTYGRLVFHGPVIGEGPMPDDGSGEPFLAPRPAAADEGRLYFGGRDWTGIKRRLANRYAQLTEEDLAFAPGGEDALFARMAARTLETRENLERFLREECSCAW